MLWHCLWLVNTIQRNKNKYAIAAFSQSMPKRDILTNALSPFVPKFNSKARRKERDGDQTTTDTKLYLEESVLERKLPDADLKMMVDLPAGLDFNEWLASHSKFHVYFSLSNIQVFVSQVCLSYSIGLVRARESGVRHD